MQTLVTRGFIPWFGQPQRHTYIHVVESLTKSIASRPPSLFREHSRSPWPRVPLRSFSTKEGGLHVSRTKLVVAAPHQAGGSKTCRRVTKTPRMAGSPSSSCQFTQEPVTRYNTLLLHSLMSYPSTLTYKDVLNLKDLITSLLGWLGDVLQCVQVFTEFQQLQNGRGNPYIQATKSNQPF